MGVKKDKILFNINRNLIKLIKEIAINLILEVYLIKIIITKKNCILQKRILKLQAMHWYWLIQKKLKSNFNLTKNFAREI
jgi:hypothetical protein